MSDTSLAPAVSAPPAVAPQSFVEQVQTAQISIPSMPGTPAPDSGQTPAATQANAPASPAVPQLTSQQTPQVSVTPEQDSAAKLAEAEKRIRDAQSKMHSATTEAAKLRTQLNSLFNDPRYQGVQDVIQGRATPATPQEAQIDVEMKRAWLEYQTAPNDEAAFAKLVSLAEERASRTTMGKVESVLQRREAEAALRQRNIAAANAINQTVAQVAPDVPLELFWAMAGRAELETPNEIQDYGQRLEWQAQRAIDLSRGALRERIESVMRSRQTQQAVTQQASVIMPAGGAAPVVGQSVAKLPNMVEAIRARQAAMFGR